MKNCLKLLWNIYCSTPIPDILYAIGPFSLLGSFESCCRLTKGKVTFWIQHSIRTSRLDQSTVDWVHPLFSHSLFHSPQVEMSFIQIGYKNDRYSSNEEMRWFQITVILGHKFLAIQRSLWSKTTVILVIMNYSGERISNDNIRFS